MICMNGYSLKKVKRDNYLSRYRNRKLPLCCPRRATDAIWKISSQKKDADLGFGRKISMCIFRLMCHLFCQIVRRRPANLYRSGHCHSKRTIGKRKGDTTVMLLAHGSASLPRRLRNETNFWGRWIRSRCSRIRHPHLLQLSDGSWLLQKLERDARLDWWPICCGRYEKKYPTTIHHMVRQTKVHRNSLLTCSEPGIQGYRKIRRWKQSPEKSECQQL